MGLCSEKERGQHGLAGQLSLLLHIVLAPLCAGGQVSPGSHPLPHPLALSRPDKIQEGEYPKAEKAGLVSSAAVGCCSSEIFPTSDPRRDAGLLRDGCKEGGGSGVEG